MTVSFKSKVALAVMDVIIILMGITLFVAGIWLKISSGLLSSDVIGLFNHIRYNDVRMGTMLNAICITMMVLGGLMIVAAILGMCGAWKMVKGCLILYMLLVVLIIITQAVLIGLHVSYYTKTDRWLRGKMMRELSTYAGPEYTDDISEGWNSLFIDARCCGVNDQYNNGQTNNDFNELSTTWYSSNKETAELLPATCCEGVTDSTVSDYKNSATCTNVPKNFYTIGCWDRTRRLARIYLLIIGISCFIAISTEIVSLILGCVVIDNAKNRIRTTGPIRGPSKAAPPYIGIDSVLRSR